MAVKCPGCAGNLLFSPSRQAMYCKMCGNTYSPEEVGTDVHASPTYECNIYTCSSCGGEVAVSGTEASGVCVFCGSPALIFNRIANKERPDGILPFQITQQQAYEKITEHIKSGKLVPDAVKKISQDNIRGIYIPYRLLSGDIHDAAVIISTVGSGKYSRSVFTGLSGSAEFRNVPIDASVSLNNEYAQKIEPFYYDDVKDFDEDYLSGFYSDIQDETEQLLKTAAEKRCDKMFCDKCGETVRGRNPHPFQSVPSIRLKDNGLYLLMPCWFYTFVSEGQPYTLLVNGQTGKIAGTVPWDKKRLIKISVAMFAGMAALFTIPFILADNELRNIVNTLFIYYSTPLAALFTIFGSITMKAIKKELSLTRDKRVFKFVKERQG